MLKGIKYIYRTYNQLKPYGAFPLFIKGIFQYIQRKIWQKKYNFHPWHCYPYTWRDYALETVNYANKLIINENLKNIYEIGCGLGDMLSHIKAKNLYGFDIETTVIEAANKHHKNIQFSSQSFDDIKHKNIDLLLLVNMLHNFNTHELINIWNTFKENNNVKFVIAETRQWYDKGHTHDLDKLFAPDYEKIWESRIFEHQRIIKCYKRTR